MGSESAQLAEGCQNIISKGTGLTQWFLWFRILNLKGSTALKWTEMCPCVKLSLHRRVLQKRHYSPRFGV